MKPAKGTWTIDTPLGRLRVVLEGGRVVSVGRLRPGAPLRADLPAPVRRLAWDLARYAKGAAVRWRVRVAPRGTRFQRRVWQAMRQIPRGHVWTYKRLARRIGRAKAARAVGQACKANPIPIVIPCHRVVAGSGLGGYSGGGTRRKKLLLRLEGALS